MRLGISILCLLPLILLAGCSPDNPRQEVSGEVTLGGVPLDEGVIDFQPLVTTDSGSATTMGGAVITSGKYLIPASHGLVPGTYKVLITSGDGVNPDNPDEPPGPTGNFVSKDRIPADFNTNSKIEVEVTADGPNVFSYDVP